MSTDTLDEPAFDTDFMIENAAGLQSVAMKIHRESKGALDNQDYRGFTGAFQAAPILLALGIEIALKAWICRGLKGGRPKGHDLLCLFERLDHKTQNLLEEAWQLREPQRTRFMSATTHRGTMSVELGEVLEVHRRVFVNWRYLYEIPNERSQSGLLDRVLTVLISAY